MICSPKLFGIPKRQLLKKIPILQLYFKSQERDRHDKIDPETLKLKQQGKLRSDDLPFVKSMQIISSQGIDIQLLVNLFIGLKKLKGKKKIGLNLYFILVTDQKDFFNIFKQLEKHQTQLNMQSILSNRFFKNLISQFITWLTGRDREGDSQAPYVMARLSAIAEFLTQRSAHYDAAHKIRTNNRAIIDMDKSYPNYLNVILPK